MFETRHITLCSDENLSYDIQVNNPKDKHYFKEERLTCLLNPLIYMLH